MLEVQSYMQKPIFTHPPSTVGRDRGHKTEEGTTENNSSLLESQRGPKSDSHDHPLHSQGEDQAGKQ